MRSGSSINTFQSQKLAPKNQYFNLFVLSYLSFEKYNYGVLQFLPCGRYIVLPRLHLIIMTYAWHRYSEVSKTGRRMFDKNQLKNLIISYQSVSDNLIKTVLMSFICGVLWEDKSLDTLKENMIWWNPDIQHRYIYAC